MKNDIYIIGCGGFAKEVFLLVKTTGLFNFKGFVDYKPEAAQLHIGKNSYPIYEEASFLRANKDNTNLSLAIGVGDPRLIRKLHETFHLFTFPNLIHPSAQFDMDMNTIGKGNIITANVVFTANVEIGNFNVFNLSATVGHDVTIGDYNVINPSVNISGGVVIEGDSLIGVGSIVLQYKKIGMGAVVGAGSVVTKDVASGLTVVGIPAKSLQK